MRYSCSSLTIVLSVLASCALPNPPLEFRPESTTVPEAALSRIRSGLGRSNIAAALGTTGRHLFTYTHAGDVYMLVCYYVRGREHPRDENGLPVLLLFKNDAMWKIVQPLPRGSHHRREEGVMKFQERSWGVTDEDHLLYIINSESGSMRTIQDELEQYKATLQRLELLRKAREPNVPPWVFVPLLMPENLERVRRDYERNHELIKTFDGARIAIGMTREDVQTIFGSEAKLVRVDCDTILCIYGSNIRLNVNPQYHFSPVAVIYRNNEVSRVYSDGFIGPSWNEVDEK